MALGLLALWPAASSAAANAHPPTSSCFWVGPAVPDRPEFNYAFPDKGAVYWTAQYSLPAGSRLLIKGRYAHARYQSLTSYNTATGVPTDGRNDQRIQPDAGSTNPYVPGALRTAPHRAYTLTVLNETSPTDPGTRLANTLYAGVAGQSSQALIYRVYVPDKNQDVTGGVGLPTPELQLADGSVLTGQELCNAVQASPNRLPVTTLPLSTYLSLRDQAGKPTTFPTENPTRFRAAYSTAFSIQCTFMGNCGGNPVRSVGQYANLDINYLTGYVNREFGPILVLHGKLPTTPHTYRNAPRAQAGQLRYWSICQNESLATTKSAGCVYDEQIPTDRKGRYTIVSSLPSDRPSNAVNRCGVAYVPWPENGDGAGHPNDGLLIVRNMLPASDFHQAVQDTRTPGDEAAVMGDYLPSGTYTTKDQFEAAGCDPALAHQP